MSRLASNAPATMSSKRVVKPLVRLRTSLPSRAESTTASSSIPGVESAAISSPLGLRDGEKV